MSPCVLRLLTTLGLLLGTAVSQAADPPGQERLPEPRRLQPPVQELPPRWQITTDYPRQNPYDVWKYYGVDRRGMFRPVVVYSPYGSYYRYNGQPFPWAETHQLEWMPYIMGDAYGR